MNAPSDRRGFLRGLVSLPLIGGGVTAPTVSAAAIVDPDRELLKAGEAWRASLARLYQARSDLFDAQDRYREAIGICPPQLAVSHRQRLEYCAAIGVASGTISTGRRDRPMPSWDAGLDPEKRTGWGSEVFSEASLNAAIALAPKNLGPAGRTPKLIRAWRELLPVARARDAVRQSCREGCSVEERQKDLERAEVATEAASKEAQLHAATTLPGLVIKARLAQFEMFENHDGFEKSRIGQRRPLLSILDSLIAIGAGERSALAMPKHVHRYRDVEFGDDY